MELKDFITQIYKNEGTVIFSSHALGRMQSRKIKRIDLS